MTGGYQIAREDLMKSQRRYRQQDLFIATAAIYDPVANGSIASASKGKAMTAFTRIEEFYGVTQLGEALKPARTISAFASIWIHVAPSLEFMATFGN